MITSKRKLLALLCYFLTNPLLMVGQSIKRGFLAGSTVFVDEQVTTFLGEATNVTIHLKHKGYPISINSDDFGVLTAELPSGTYLLHFAENKDGSKLEFAKDQEKSFKMRSGRVTRFDIMLLKPK